MAFCEAMEVVCGRGLAVDSPTRPVFGGARPGNVNIQKKNMIKIDIRFYRLVLIASIFTAFNLQAQALLADDLD